MLKHEDRCHVQTSFFFVFEKITRLQKRNYEIRMKTFFPENISILGQKSKKPGPIQSEDFFFLPL